LRGKSFGKNSVDDDPDAAELLGLLLDQAGNQTSVVFSAHAALTAASEFQPEVAFIEVGLPAVDGCTLVELLRSVPGLEDCRLVAITAYVGRERVARSLAAGFHEHLTKPLDLDAVLDAVAGSPRIERGARGRGGPRCSRGVWR
jgi:CheY-like chemotaxis protein